MAARRVAMAARSSARGGSSRIGGEAPGRRLTGTRLPAARPRPVLRHTSQARATRWLSVGRSRAAVAGSTSARRACSARADLLQQAPRLLARGRHRGRGWRPGPRSGTAKYRPVPPVRIGRRPASRACSIAASAASRHQATLPGFGGGPDAVERVRHARFLLRRRARGEDAQLAIHLHGVGVDDRAAAGARRAPAPAPICRWRWGRRRSEQAEMGFRSGLVSR